jgi:hypothetical protein
MSSDRSAYFKDWWAKNGHAYRKKRRARYHTDAEFRRRQREWTKNYLESNRKHVADTARTFSIRATTINGKQVPLWPITELSSDSGLARPRVIEWEDKGFIPRTPIICSGGNRYYTENMIDVFSEVIGSYGTERWVSSNRLLYYLILEGWRGTGIRLNRRYSLQPLLRASVGSIKIATLASLIKMTLSDDSGVMYWEATGIIPRTPLTYRGVTVYTERMCNIAVRAILKAKASGNVCVRNTKMVNAIKCGWKRELSRYGLGKIMETGDTADVREIQGNQA